MKLVLASKSPRRKELLARLCPDFEIITAETDETLPTGTISSVVSELQYSSSLKTVVISSGERIDDYAFRYCYSLMSITIPSSVTSIGDYAFYNCSSLEELPSGCVPDGRKPTTKIKE